MSIVAFALTFAPRAARSCATSFSCSMRYFGADEPASLRGIRVARDMNAPVPASLCLCELNTRLFFVLLQIPS